MISIFTVLVDLMKESKVRWHPVDEAGCERDTGFFALVAEVEYLAEGERHGAVQGAVDGVELFVRYADAG